MVVWSKPAAVESTGTALDHVLSVYCLAQEGSGDTATRRFPTRLSDLLVEDRS